MSDTMILKTSMKLEGGRVTSTFSGHVNISIAGTAAIAERPDAWTPLHMLVAATESCFFLTLSAIAEKMRLEIESYASTAEGRLTSADGKHKEVSEIVLRPTVALKGGDEKGRLSGLIAMAEEHCPVARSLKTVLRIER